MRSRHDPQAEQSTRPQIFCGRLFSRSDSVRITELDAARGIGILGMLAAHFIFDLTILFPSFSIPSFCSWIYETGGLFFVVLSGMTAGFSKTPFRHGMMLFIWGLLLAAVTYLLESCSLPVNAVRFGILELLGISMMTVPLLRKHPAEPLLVFAVCLIIAGSFISGITVRLPFLYPLGLKQSSFVSGDYWPIIPNYGYYILGLLAGSVLYKEKKARFPRLQGKLRFLSFFGRNSLIIYLIHQPLLILIVFVIRMFTE